MSKRNNRNTRLATMKARRFLVTTEQAAYQLDCSERHVRRLVTRGVLTNHGTPRRILVDAEELEQAVVDGAVRCPVR